MSECVTWNELRTVVIFLVGIVITEILHFIDLRRQLKRTQDVLLVQSQTIRAQEVSKVTVDK